MMVMATLGLRCELRSGAALGPRYDAGIGLRKWDPSRARSTVTRTGACKAVQDTCGA